jgi:hypothetical protein
VHLLPAAAWPKAQRQALELLPGDEAALQWLPGDEAAVAAVHSPARQQEGADEAAGRASEAEALTQRISRRWFRRNPQSSRSTKLSNFASQSKMPDHHDAALYVSADAKISGPSSIPFASRTSAA